ncbi:hypothetical protein M378DRAFT_919061 [Amanita muscaria Koide BX008]|uniref:Uncharacterized protein n=1 Tax=Amanita muscaria (strain Koide BX008) TaxID=946122 RepID=A0A0C2WGF3_AMAMK|nr:hypothetical protein M378DRAFT_919061 [Amanita muscaria Koide BX008]
MANIDSEFRRQHVSSHHKKCFTGTFTSFSDILLQWFACFGRRYSMTAGCKRQSLRS